MSLLEWLSHTAPVVWMRESESVWGYPTVLFLHTFGLGLLVGFTAAIDLRVLGFTKRLPLAPMARFFRFVWIGFWINAVSGTLLLMMAPTKLGNPAFIVKMLLIALGVVNMWFLKRRVFRDPAGVGEAPIPAGGRLLAASSLVIWAGAITAGRLMAYIGNGR
jgi:hypothetical protein